MSSRQKDAQYAATTIRAFLDDTAGDWDWDDFTSCSLRDPAIDDIRRRAARVELPLGSEDRQLLEALAAEADKLTSD
jgi:hypothetical protein